MSRTIRNNNSDREQPVSASGNKQTQSLRILIAEDHTILSEGLRALISNEPGMEVAGIAENGLEAVSAVEQLAPDLVLMDLSMPEMDGLSAIREILRRGIKAKILVLTAHKTEEHIRAALQAGANGFALKDCPHSELLVAIRTVVSGKTYISPYLAGGFTKNNPDIGNQQPVFLAASETLTERETQVLLCVVRGLRNRETALNLSINIKTVEKHRANVMRKLKLANAAELTAFACKNGLMSDRK